MKVQSFAGDLFEAHEERDDFLFVIISVHSVGVTIHSMSYHIYFD